VKYAIYLPLFSPFGSARIIADLARDAEQAGWDGVFIWDDVAGWDRDMTDPWVALSAAAVATDHIRLGALITPLARRRPWKFARETVSLDHLSGGRLVVGVGVGGGQEQFGDLGDEPNQRARGDMLDEGLEVVTGLWSGEPFEYEGKHYHIKKTVFRPKPLQEPRIPIWVAGVWPNKRPMERMARWDGMFPLFWGVDDLAQQQAHLREMVARVEDAREANRPRGQKPGSFDVVVTGETDPAHAAEQVSGFAQAGASWWLESLNPERVGASWYSYSQLRERVLAGPPKLV
jgi:alkanesulfonate monooxygenase SsuD/methylene tetrahydromethanopterin reductase-like flavin-dependent oxidoreductase (luciferase family)